MGSWIGGVLALAALAACDAAPASTDAGPPDAGSVEPDYDGPEAEVEIRRDDLGICHVYAASDTDAFYGGGYAMARDRLFQMEILRRRAYGRLAEVLGSSARADDQIARTLGFGRSARADALRVARESPEAWRLLSAWAAGIDARIAEIERGEAPMPTGFAELGFAPEPWTPVDLLAVSRAAFFVTASTLEAELLVSVVRNLAPEAFDAVRVIQPLFSVPALPPEDRPAVGSGAEPPPPRSERRHASEAELREAAQALRTLGRALAPFRLVGSNNVAIAGAHTASGRPLLANDPHLSLESPNVMIPIHLESASRGGTLDVAGFTLAGSVGVSLGHNRHVAWSATTSFADVMDVWEVRDLGDAIEAWGETLPVVRREEPIVVRGKGMPAGQGTTIAFVVREVPGIGVLLPRDIAPVPIAARGHALLFGWTGFSALAGASSLLDLQRAQSAAEAERAIAGVPTLGFNFLFVDRDTIGYRVGQAVPDRGAPSDARPPWRVLDGDDPASRWTGAFLPPERMPRSSGGARGWLATANADPFGFTADGRLDGDPWYYGAIFDPGFRAVRLEQELARLTARGAITPEDLEALQTDVHSSVADVLVPILAASHARLATDPALADLRGAPGLDDLVTLLGSWDRRMSTDSAGALAFRALALRTASGVLRDDVGPLFDAALEYTGGAFLIVAVAMNALLGRFPEGAAVLQEGADRIVLEAARDVAAWMIARFGGVPGEARYGAMHGAVFDAVFRGPLDQPFVETRGAEDTVDNAPAAFSMDAESRWESRYGPVFRAIYEIEEDGTPAMRVAFPLGVSGEPSSPHARDRLDDWLAGRYRHVPYRRAEVEARTEETTVLR